MLLPAGALQADCFRESDAYPKVFQSNYYTSALSSIAEEQNQMYIQAMTFSCVSSGGSWQSSGSSGWYASFS